MTNQRIASWLFLLLLILTSLLLFAVRVPPWGYVPVQSLLIFGNLPLFASLYTVWLTLLILLVWHVRTARETAVLVNLFVLVYVGAVILATSYGAGEDWLKAADPVQIQKTGRIDFLGYRDFPALALVGAMVAAIANAGILTLRTPLLSSWLISTSTLLFVCYSRFIPSRPLAALAVLVAVQSNLVMSRFYLHPIYLGVLLYVALMSVVLARKQSLGIRERLLAILIMAGVTMTHFVSSVVGLLLLTAFPLENWWHKRSQIVSHYVVVLGFTLITMWGVYWTVQTFRNVVGYLPEIVTRFQQGIAFFWISRVARANTEGLPFWVTMVQMFWWITVYFGGGVVALRNVFIRSSLHGSTSGFSGAYVLLAAASVLGTFASPGGYDFYRFILYGSFLAAPLVLHFLCSRPGKIVSSTVSAVFLTLSFPSLVAHNSSISQQATHLSEATAAQFLGREVEGMEETTKLFGGYTGPDKVIYYAPGLIPNMVNFPAPPTDVKDFEEVRTLWRDYANSFTREANRGEGSVLIFDYQERVYWRHLLRVSEDDELWDKVRQDLGKANLFYDAGRVQIYR